MPRTLLLRLLLAIIDAARWLAPRSRRREWRRQWRADIANEWRWLAQHPDDVAGRVTLARRTLGALRHAFWLRGHARRVEMITQDLRYGWRHMLGRPGMTAAAVLTLGLGIGANVTMYSWIDGRIREPLTGVDHGERIVALNVTSSSRQDISTSYPDFVDYRAQRPATVDDLIAYTLAPMNLRTDADPVRVFGELVSGNYFATLGVRPVLGRTFFPDEDTTPNRDAVVVLSHSCWQRRFGGDPSIVGRTLTLNGRAFTVIGVAPRGFHGVEPYLNIDMWVPMMMQPAVGGSDRLGARGNHWLDVMVRLKPGVTVARAESDLQVIAQGIARAYPQQSFDGIKLYELWRAPSMGGSSITAVMGVQLAVAGVVLLIACANVANLLLASAATRQRETAVRLTLGASRGRLVQQMLTESTLLAALGGIAGVAFAYWTKDLVRVFIPPAPLPIELNPSLNGVVLLFALGITAATAIIFGLMPALQGSAWSIVGALKESAGSVTASPRSARLRKVLVAAQVALSLVLLISSALFIRTLVAAQTVDPGFTARDGLLATIDLVPAGYDEARGRAFYRLLLARVRELPGVQAATLMQRMPLGFGGNSSFIVSVDGYSPAPKEEMLVYYSRVAPHYLRTLGIHLVAGRDFDDRDTADVTPVAIVNETMVRRYFEGRNPIGGRVKIGPKTVAIVGVARDGKYGSITESPRPFMYVPLDQWYRSDVVLAARSTSPPGALLPTLQAAVRSLDANIPLFDVRTIAEQLEIAVFVQRMIGSMLGAFGALALLLATVGLYAVIAAIAAQRTPEIGMRMALGAGARDIVRLILGQAVGMIGAGVIAGLLLAAGATQLFKSLLVGVAATDAVSFAGTTALLLLVGLAASYLPARRAAAIDPLAALRNE
jgi:putative ABC transport system permease protein